VKFLRTVLFIAFPTTLVCLLVASLPLLLYVLPTTSCVSLVACAIIFMLVGTHKIMETSRHSCPGSFHAQTSRHSIFSPKLWGIVPIPATLLDLYVVMAGSRTLCTWVVTHVLFAWAMHAHLHFSRPKLHRSTACPNLCICSLIRQLLENRRAIGELGFKYESTKEL
jgi:hypothetical protein